MFDLSSIALAFGACVVFVATALIVWLGIVKEHHWDSLREASNEKIAILELDAAKSNAEAAKANQRIAELSTQSEELKKATADANARAAEAQLALQKYKGPRNLEIEPFLAKLATAPPAKVQVVYVRECTDCFWLGQFIASFLVTAKWESWYGPIDEVAVTKGPFPQHPSALSLRARPWGITILAASVDNFGKAGTSLEALFQALLPTVGGDLTVTNDPDLPTDIIRVVIAPKA